MVGKFAFRLSLPRSWSAPRDARHGLAAWMPQRCCAATSETAMLLTCELVTNSLVHTRSDDVDVRATCDGDVLRVAVADSAVARPPVRAATSAEPPPGEGRGLWLVTSLAERWGWEQLPTGKRVWFEVPCTGPEAAVDCLPEAVTST